MMKCWLARLKITLQGSLARWQFQNDVKCVATSSATTLMMVTVTLTLTVTATATVSRSYLLCFVNYIYLTTINWAAQRGCLQQIRCILCAINTIQFNVARGVYVISKGSHAYRNIDVFRQITNCTWHLP